jgi:hypothetical protein
VAGFCAESAHEPLPVGETGWGGARTKSEGVSFRPIWQRPSRKRGERRLGETDFVLAGGARAEPSHPR